MQNFTTRWLRSCLSSFNNRSLWSYTFVLFMDHRDVVKAYPANREYVSHQNALSWQTDSNCIMHIGSKMIPNWMQAIAILNHLWNNSMKAQWIRLRLPYCCPGFVSQARFFQFIKKLKLNICKLNYNVKRRKINEKVAGIGPFLEQLNESKKRNI